MHHPGLHTLITALSGGPAPSMEASSGPTGAVTRCPPLSLACNASHTTDLRWDYRPVHPQQAVHSVAAHLPLCLRGWTKGDPSSVRVTPSRVSNPPVPGASQQTRSRLERSCPSGSVCCCGWDDRRPGDRLSASSRAASAIGTWPCMRCAEDAFRTGTCAMNALCRSSITAVLQSDSRDSRIACTD